MFPPPGPDTPDGETAAAAARALARLMGDFEPDLVISDILTLAPTLAAEVAGVPHATLIPHVYPVQEAGMPLYSLGFQPPRTPLGRVGLAGDDADSGERAAAGAGRSESRPGSGWGWRRWIGFTGGSASCWRWWRRSPSWSIRGGGRRTCG